MAEPGLFGIQDAISLTLQFTCRFTIIPTFAMPETYKNTDHLKGWYVNMP